MADTDVVVIGAGLVGLATADALRRRLGAQVMVIDKEPGPALHQSGRNSGVVHSGLYYAPGSAKARLVSEGRSRLVDRCADWGVEVRRCGKVVVATSVSELDTLEELERRGRANGVEVGRLVPAELARLEPHVAGIAALHVPDASITDFAAVAHALVRELAGDGVEFRFGSPVTWIRPVARGGSDAGVRVATPSREISARWLVNCAGLHSDRVARLAGSDTQVRIVPFRGDYYELVAGSRHLVNGLVYPVPDPRWPFLGVHLTPDVDGGVHVGPNAVLALGREAYRGGVDPADAASLLTTPGLWRLGRRYWRTGAQELVRSRSVRRFVAEAQRLVPELGPDDLVRSGSGIRAQAVAPDGRLLDDFAFAASHRAVHVLNAPSPAATASLAIGEVVAQRLAALRAESG